MADGPDVPVPLDNDTSAIGELVAAHRFWSRAVFFDRKGVIASTLAVAPSDLEGAMALFEGTRDDAITAGLDLDGIHFDVHRWYVRQPADTTADEGGGGSDDPPAVAAADGAVDLCYGRHGSVGLESIGFCLACMGVAAGGGREGQAGEEEAAEGDFYALVTYDYPFTSARVIPDLVAFMRDHVSSKRWLTDAE